MRIGIDISQVVYEGTGVAKYMRELTRALLSEGEKHEFILFGSAFRRRKELVYWIKSLTNRYSNVQSVILPFPPVLLDFLWNRLHILPISLFVRNLDVFFSSDWAQPPLGNVLGVTTIHDLIVLKEPETFANSGFRNILAAQKRRLRWVAKECCAIFCDSEATKKDIMELLHVPERKLQVVYPGFRT